MKKEKVEEKAEKVEKVEKAEKVEKPSKSESAFNSAELNVMTTRAAAIHANLVTALKASGGTFSEDQEKEHYAFIDWLKSIGSGSGV